MTAHTPDATDYDILVRHVRDRAVECKRMVSQNGATTVYMGEAEYEVLLRGSQEPPEKFMSLWVVQVKEPSYLAVA